MANVRLNIFDNYPLLHNFAGGGVGTNGALMIHGVFIPGSLSFNNVVMAISASGTTAKTLTLSFGLYSLTGSTLSLANSASRSSNPGANMLSWITLATSATQDITPGNWYFAILSATAGNSRMSLMHNKWNQIVSEGIYGGIFVRGRLSISTNALPASIATSDLSKEGGDSSALLTRHPYIIISA